MKTTHTEHCSFCGRPESDGARLIAGGGGHLPPVSICVECIELCRQIIRIESTSPSLAQNTELRPWASLTIEGRTVEWMAMTAYGNDGPIVLILVRKPGSRSGPAMVLGAGTIPTEVHAHEAFQMFKDQLE